jgi:hypothetical protein
MRQQMRALEGKIGLAHDPSERPTCPLSRYNGTGEVYDSADSFQRVNALWASNFLPLALPPAIDSPQFTSA